jgi:hypothetical protein
LPNRELAEKRDAIGSSLRILSGPERIATTLTIVDFTLRRMRRHREMVDARSGEWISPN